MAVCNGPLWVVDDLSPCFQERFLYLIFPITACGVSVLLLLIHSLLRLVVRLRRKAYVPVPQIVVVHDGVESDPEDTEGDAESDLMLYKAVSRTTDVSLQVDRPRGRVMIVCAEVLALLGAVGVNAALIDASSGGRYSRTSAIARLSSWIYILLLTSIRLLLTTSERPNLPKFWRHTACLYGLQWLFIIFVFRSVIVHPPSRLIVSLVSTDFACSSLLVLLAVTTRKGNETLVVEHEDGLTPPKDLFASISSLISFSWMDSLIYQGYKRTLEIPDVWNLRPSYQAGPVLMDFRRAKRATKLTLRLLRYFDRTLLMQGAWTVLAGLFTFLPSWLLKLILEHVEDPQSVPLNAAWLYVILLFVSGVIQAVGDGQSLWMGRQLSVKLRAIIIGELYAKALRRKAGASVEHGEKDGDQEQTKNNKKSKSSKQKTQANGDAHKDDPVSEYVDTQANIGKIINLMAIDSFKVSEICAYLHFLWASVPVQVVVAVVLLYKILGFSSLAGIVLMVLILPFNLVLAAQFRKAQNNILAGTDARIHSTNEMLQNIRIIKYFAWEQRFEGIVNDKRRTELKYLRKRYILWSLAATLWYGTPLIITFCTFFIYTVIEGKRLVPSIAFPALSMFALLRVPLDRLADMVAHVLESKVSLDRVENFLNEEETEKYAQLRHSNHDHDQEPKITLENATLSWGSPAKKNKSTMDSSTEAFRLINMDVTFRIGKLNIIAGPTGSGKTSVLMALLGEMQLIEGSVYLPGGLSDRADLPVDPSTGLTESVAYCAQEAWLVNATIKDNILFAAEFDESRYEEVLKVCALERDLEILDAGDETVVGEKGISLSGGQKQRISLARAIYSNARHILLDDCLSAVDSHTAKHIFSQALMGPLMLNRTCILVTHNVSLVLPRSDYVVLMDNGRVSAQGSPTEVVASGALGQELLQSRPGSGTGSQLGSRVPSNLEETRDRWTNGQSTDANGAANGAVSKRKKKPAAAATHQAEEKVTGSVPLSTIMMYLRAMGSWYYWVFALLVFFVQQLGSLAPNIWVRQWANAYETQSADLFNSSATHLASISDIRLPTFVSNLGSKLVVTAPQDQLGTQDTSSGGINVTYYLVVYAILALVYAFVSFFREVVLFWGSLHASWKIHERLLRAVTHAKFRFFDSTPMGRIMNRFSKDMEAIDQDVSPTAIGVLHCLAAVIMTVILISVITPGFLIAGVFITVVYCGLGAFYLNTSRDLKRLESVQRSPLYQQFGETLNGVVTIRAYGDGARFILDNHQLINTYNRPYLYLWASNRWLSFRVDVTGALVSFFSATFILLNTGRIDAGAAGLSLTYAVTFTENVLWLVRLYSENQQNMNSVERLEEYLNVEQEAQAVVPDNRPARNWPSKGALKFIDYSTRYRPELGLVLKHISFNVLPGERVGIVGRTGAGKSSLALALFRGLEAETGKILIDDVDIGLIGLQDLREAITIVPQDPTLFTGTIRSNLDPFGHYTDEEIFTSLRRVHLLGAATASDAGATTQEEDNGDPGSSTASVSSSRYKDNKNMFLNLQSSISESGSNLSQGQRQLLCLARALLKSPKVLMMDEATASIDYATDAKIQDTLRELTDNTIVTIAHRLQTIIDYDKVLVLEHGRLEEFDGPWQLINKSDGIFRSMCENTGNMDALFEGAKKAWEQKRLVDDS